MHGFIVKIPGRITVPEDTKGYYYEAEYPPTAGKTRMVEHSSFLSILQRNAGISAEENAEKIRERVPKLSEGMVWCAMWNTPELIEKDKREKAWRVEQWQDTEKEREQKTTVEEAADGRRAKERDATGEQLHDYEMKHNEKQTSTRKETANVAIAGTREWRQKPETQEESKHEEDAVVEAEQDEVEQEWANYVQDSEPFYRRLDQHGNLIIGLTYEAAGHEMLEWCYDKQSMTLTALPNQPPYRGRVSFIAVR